MNNDIRNLEILKEKSLSKIDTTKQYGENLDFIGVDEEKTKWFKDKNGNPVGIFRNFDEEQAAKIDKDLMQAIFFFGIGSVEEIIRASELANPQSVFVIIEPNSSILNTVLSTEDLSLIKKVNCVFITGGLDDFEINVKKLTYSRILLILRNPVFYFNSYYYSKELKIVKKYIEMIRTILRDRFFRMGNDVHDSLMGLMYNIRNMPTLLRTPDVAWLKDKFSGCPIFVIAAGPSLDKNIHELKHVGNKGIIIAVDTIAEKLVRSGIEPHFITSVERFNVWEYFYKDKPEYYRHSYLVGPLLVQPEVVELYQERAIYPLRESTRENEWLSELLEMNEDYFMWMGGSCAHVATGLAMHLGGSPIVLVGQDLAYGEDISKTHADGTEYDEKPEAPPEEVYTVDGYYGNPVKTQEIWNHFRSLYEDAFRSKESWVINATEGGARIKGTEQLSLREAVERYCVKEFDCFGLLKDAPRSNFDMKKVEDKLKKYCMELERDSEKALKHYINLKKIYDDWDRKLKKMGVDKIYQLMKKSDEFFQSIPDDKLKYHNLQSQLMVILQKFHTIPQNGETASLKQNMELQLEFCGIYTNVVWMMAQVIRENFPWSQKEEKKC